MAYVRTDKGNVFELPYAKYRPSPDFNVVAKAPTIEGLIMPGDLIRVMDSYHVVQDNTGSVILCTDMEAIRAQDVDELFVNISDKRPVWCSTAVRAHGFMEIV